MKKTSFLLSALLIMLAAASCSKGSSTSTSGGANSGGSSDCSTISAKFSTDVAPIIASNCAISGCHNGTQSPTLNSYAQIAANAASINVQVQSGAMPKTGSLSTTQKKIINCWVQSGAPNN